MKRKTTTTYLEWDKVSFLIKRLEKDGDYKFMLLVSIGCFLGLRVSDIKQLKWKDLLESEVLTITEKKTGKVRKLIINYDLRNIIAVAQQQLYTSADEYVFINRFRTGVITTQYINQKLKVIFRRYSLKIQASSHSLRKSFGRKVYENHNQSEHALVLLMNIFNHSSIQTTRLYLGLRQEEINDVYQTMSLF
jgi:integrase